MEESVKFYLAERVPFTFSWDVIGEGVTALFTETEIQVRRAEVYEPDKELTDKLRSAFRGRDLEWSIHLDYKHPSLSAYLARCEYARETEFRLVFPEGSRLTEVLGESSLQVEVFDVSDASGEQLYGFTTQEMRPGKPFRQGDCRNFVDLTRNAGIHQILSQDRNEEITGKMNLILIDKSYVRDPKQMVPCKRMLEEELGTDAVIVASNGMEVKCHRGFLAVHSDVFRTMFVTDMQEAKTQRIEMPDMSEEGVRAFLAYLYHWDLSKVEESSPVALELLKAAHKYNVGTLEGAMRKLLLSKPESWYDVDVALKLYLFVRNFDSEWEPLKKKAVMVTKMGHANLNKSTTYQELFRENPEAAMNLHQYTISVLSSTSPSPIKMY